MKHTTQRCTMIMVIMLLATIANAAGKVKYTYGKPSTGELEMRVYDKDTTAAAVVLHKSCELKYQYTSYSKNEQYTNYTFNMTYTVKVRLKILKEEGKKYADVAIPYINHVTDKRLTERFSYFNVQTHNIIDGKKITTVLPDDLLFDERNSDTYMTRRFCAPAVRVGSVVEYQYDLTSNVVFHIYDWNMQDDIPVAYAMCRMEIPTVLTFNVEISDSPYMTIQTSRGHMRLSPDETRPTRIYHATGTDMPAVKETSYVWNTDDYRAKIRAELRSSGMYDGEPVKYFGTTWDQVDSEVLRESGISSRMDSRSRYEERLLEEGIDTIADIRERVMAVYRFLHRRIRWNEKYNAEPKSQSEVIRLRSGSSADLNMLMLNMLNSVGIKANPVVLSTRSNGSLPSTYPSRKMLNTMVLAVNDNSDTLFIDAASPHGCINVLPPDLAVRNARVLDKHARGYWADLTSLAKGTLTSCGRFTLDRDGIIDGTVSRRLTDVLAMNERSEYAKARDSLDYVMRTGNRFAVKVDSHSISGIRDNAAVVLQDIRLRKQFDIRRGKMYVSPYVMMPVSVSPFKEERRTLPVEMPYRFEYDCTTRVTLPAEYEVESIPDDINMTNADGSLSLHVAIRQESDELVVTYRMSSDKLIYKSNEYEALKLIYDTIGHRMNDFVVLKR